MIVGVVVLVRGASEYLKEDGAIDDDVIPKSMGG